MSRRIRAAWVSCIAVCAAAMGMVSPTLALAAGPLKLDFQTPQLRRQLLAGDKDAPSLTAPRAVQTPVIDGRLDEVLWKSAAEATFGAAPRTTRARIAFDAANLYLAFECAGDRPPVAAVAEQDGPVHNDDCIEIWITGPGSKAEQVQLIVNAKGIAADIRGRDGHFNPAWSRAAQIAGNRWTVEAAVPFASLGFGAAPAGLWANFGRNGPGDKPRSWTEPYGAAAGRVVLEGVTEAESDSEEEMDASALSLATSGQGLSVTRCQTEISAGERWAVVRAQVDIRRHRQAVIAAELYPIGGSEAVASVEEKASFGEVWVWADLRQTGLSRGRLRLWLREGGKTLGAAEMLLSAAGPVLAMTPGQRVEVNLDVPEGLELPGGQTAVTFGFPVPEGALWDAAHLRVVNRAGQVLPFQSEVTGRWNKDGAVQWVRFDAVVKPAEGCFVEYHPGATTASLAAAVTVSRQGEQVVLETGGVRYVLGADVSPIQEVRVGDQVVASSRHARGLYVVDQTGRVGVASGKGATVAVEASGPVAASVRIEGPYVDSAGQTLARHITRVEAFAGQPAAKITHTLVLVNDTNQVWFKDVGWAFKTSVGANPVALFNRSRENPGDFVEHRLGSGEQAVTMFQDSHMRYQAGANHFAIAAENAGGQLRTLAEGQECGDWAALRGGQGMVVLGCREAARQHPKEFYVTPDGIELKLFSPRGGEELDFRVDTRMKIWNITAWLDSGAVSAKNRPGAEDRIRQIPSNAIGWSKTHELTLAALPGAATPAGAATVGQLNSQGVLASADPRWVYQTRVLGPLHPRDPQRFPQEEKLLDSTFEWYKGWGERVGEWGFVDAFAGPHMTYRGKLGFPIMRRFPLTYTVRRDFWLLYARSGDRDIRCQASDSVRTFMDGCMARWDGDGKVKGFYISEGDGAQWGKTSSPESVPLYWQGKTTYEISSTADLQTFLLFYHLTGYRRALEAVTDYSQALKRIWKPSVNRRAWRQMRLLLQQLQCYVHTGDETFRIMAEDLVDAIWEPEGELRINRDKPYGSGYKMQSDTTCVEYAWQVLRDRRLAAMRDAVLNFCADEYLGQHPYQYSFPMGLVSTSLYEKTGDPALATGAMLSNRLAVGNYDPAAATFGKIGLVSPFMRGIFEGVPYHMHLVSQTDADRRSLVSWAGFEVGDQPVTVFFRKEARQRLDLRVINGQSKAVLGQAGAGPVLQVWEGGNGRQANTWTLGLNEVSSGKGNTAHVQVPLDAPAGTYMVWRFAKGQTLVLANQSIPLIVEAPGGFTPADAVRRVYFKLPAGSAKARLLVEQSATLLGPDGKPFRAGKSVQGWVDLPADRPGVWGIEVTKPGRIQLENVPPRFAFEDPAFYFDPPVKQELKAGAED